MAVTRATEPRDWLIEHGGESTRPFRKLFYKIDSISGGIARAPDERRALLIIFVRSLSQSPPGGGKQDTGHTGGQAVRNTIVTGASTGAY